MTSDVLDDVMRRDFDQQLDRVFFEPVLSLRSGTFLVR